MLTAVNDAICSARFGCVQEYSNERQGMCPEPASRAAIRCLAIRDGEVAAGRVTFQTCKISQTTRHRKYNTLR